MEEIQVRQNLDEELKNIKKERDRQDQMYWDLHRYIKLLHILNEAKQLAKELEDEINGIKPELSFLEKN